MFNVSLNGTAEAWSALTVLTARNVLPTILVANTHFYHVS